MAFSAPPAAVRSTLQRLPLHDLTPDDFESFCRDFISELPGVVECHRYGVQGNPQRGIDLVAKMADGQTNAHQCRRVQEFGAAALAKLVGSVLFEADHYYLLLACNATTGLRDEAEKHERWTVWDVDDISAKVRQLPQEKARRIIRTHFGASYCRDFLGLQPVTTFLLPDDFFAPFLNSRKIFNHCSTLAGRVEILAQLEEFLRDKDKLIFALTGRGGIGKSKVLHAFARHAERSHDVYFAQLDVDISLASLGELPSSNTVIVVDDAHRRKDLGLLFGYAVRTRTKLVLSTRPQLKDELPSRAAQHNIEPKEIVSPDALGPLARNDVEALAREVLGEELQHHAADLATVTRDCPLITIVGGRLLRDRRVAPALLANDDEFREIALAKFFDEIIENAKPGSEEEAVRRLLEVIAALAPVHPRSKRFASAAESLAGMSLETASQWCDRLERHGVLAQRDGLRIVPDVLSDYILGVACTRPAGTGGTFVQKIVAAVGDFDHALLKNLAAVDWRVGRKTGEELRVLGEVWASVTATFERAPNSERREMLRNLKEVGLFLPRQMLALAKHALDFPSSEPETGPFAAMVTTTHEDVIAHLPEVVRYTAYSPLTFDSACDFLWRLANDPRVGQPHRGLGEKDALTILQGIMAPSPRKSSAVHEKLMDRVETWRNIARSSAERIHIVSIVKAAFAKTGTDHQPDDRSVTIASFGVPPSFVRDVRARGFAIASEALNDADRGVVAAGVKAFKALADPPQSFMGLHIPDEIHASWRPERAAALQQLEQLAKRTGDPVITTYIRESVDWLAEANNGPTEDEVRNAASRVIRAIPDGLPHRVAQVISRPWGSIRAGEDRQQQAALLMERSARELAAAMLPADAVKLLEDVLAGLHQLARNANPGPFLSTITRVSPSFAVALCREIIRSDGGLLASHVSSLLMPMRDGDREQFDALVAEIERRDARRSAASMLWAFRWWMAGDNLTADLINIRRLFGMGGEVVVAGLEVLPKLVQTAPELAIELLMAVEFGDDQRAAESLAEAFDDPERALFNVITDEQLRVCLLKFDAVPQLDGTHLGEFIEECAARIPIAVLELLARRIQRDAEAAAGYTALPFDLPTLAFDEQLAASDPYQQLLFSFAEQFLRGHSFEASRLLGIAVGEINSTAAAFIRAFSARRSKPTMQLVAASLHGPECRRYLVTHPEFVEQLLGDAAAVDHEHLRLIEEAIYSCIVPRTTTRVDVQDVLSLSVLLRDSLPIGSRTRDLFDRIATDAQRIKEKADEAEKSSNEE